MTNLVIIMTDQQRYDSLGCLGNPIARTPALDALGAGGARLGNHFTPNQICSPSRATLFSGLYPRHHGLTRNGVALDPDVELLSHVLTGAGYRSHGIGKFHFQPILAPAEHAMPDSEAFWENPENAAWTGPFYGFETVDMLIGESAVSTNAGHYADWLRRNHPSAAPLYRREHALAPPPADLDEVWKCALPPELHYNSWIAERACGFLERAQADRPFFLFVSFPDPHHPFAPPAPWCDLVDPDAVPAPRHVPGERRLMPDYIQACGSENYLDFLMTPGRPREQGFMTATDEVTDATLRQAIAHTHGAIAMIDAAIGRILETLGDTGRDEDTIIVFTSDHGELLGDHGLLRKGPPPYRQITQVPFLISGPGIRPGAISALTSHLDVKATLLDLLGQTGNEGDGRSFASQLTGGDGPERAELFGEYHPRVISDQYNQTIVTRDWRLTIYPHRRDWGELFDRRRDPHENNNLFHAVEQKHIRDKMIARLEAEWPPAPTAGGEVLAVY